MPPQPPCGNTDTGSEPVKQERPQAPPPAAPSPAPKPATKPSGSEIPVKPATDEDRVDAKIVMLGTGESGKTTVIRQLKIAYCGGYSQDQRTRARSAIRWNVIEDIKKLVSELDRQGTHEVSAVNVANRDLVVEMEGTGDDLSCDSAPRILSLWRDPAIRLVYDKSSNLGVGDNAHHFLDNVERIAGASWLPSDDDLVLARIRTIGQGDDLRMKAGKSGKVLEVCDVGGQRNERKRWKQFQEVQCVIYVVSLSDFDQQMFESEDQSRTEDSMRAFEDSLGLFSTAGFFLLFNKLDLFRKKLSTSEGQAAFSRTYGGFRGNAGDPTEALEHVKGVWRRLAEGKGLPWVDVGECCATVAGEVRSCFQRLLTHFVS